MENFWFFVVAFFVFLLVKPLIKKKAIFSSVHTCRAVIENSVRLHGFDLVEIRIPSDSDWKDSPFIKPTSFWFTQDVNPSIRNLFLREYFFLVLFKKGEKEFTNWVQVRQSLLSKKKLFWAVPLKKYKM